MSLRMTIPMTIPATGRRTMARATAGALAIAVLLLVTPAGAASLQQVSNWGGAGLPSDVSMYVYVPTKVAAKPPILTLIHYCGGTASAVFGQAQGGGIVSAADQYGFIMVVPSSGRCWDVESNKAWTRSGGGDSDAIKQMVTYAIGKYGANADRVYSTGDSSGAMMTELLLALYPDIFKAGSAMAGMPAGCRGTNETGTGYSGACAGGTVMHTAQQWGDIARNMDPGYVGHRPRVQMFHGSSDTTISPTNLSQAVLEWTNVLGLNASPDTTTMGVQLGMHQATRQQWKNSCGYLVLDTFLSMGGDHGPSDALFLSQYVIPFLGLDKVGDVDPEIAQCGNGGVGGASGQGGAGVGGQPAGGHSGSGGQGSGGQSSAGGRAGSGGASGSGGIDGGAGKSATGGTTQPTGSGGVVGSGGSSGQTGNPGSGGHASGGDTGHSGGTGGTAVTSSGGSGSGGTSGSGGAGGNAPQETDSAAGGCSCAMAQAGSRDARWGGLMALGLAISLVARRRRRAIRR